MPMNYKYQNDKTSSGRQTGSNKSLSYQQIDQDSTIFVVLTTQETLIGQWTREVRSDENCLKTWIWIK